MGKKGIILDYDADRADDLRQAAAAYYRAVAVIPPDAMDNIVNMPAARFYVSDERAKWVITQMLKGADNRTMRPTKRAMYREIFARFQQLRKKQPTLSIDEAVRQIIEQPAPHFYLAPAYAQRILRQHRARWRKEMLQKLQHWR